MHSDFVVRLVFSSGHTGVVAWCLDKSYQFVRISLLSEIISLNRVFQTPGKE